MRKILSLTLAMALVLTLFVGFGAFAEEMTEVGTPRNETLIMETQTPTDLPGNFNSYFRGVQNGFGIHQLITAHLWEMDTAAGDQFGEIADGMPTPNEDFTQFTMKVRQGMKWSDGEDITADDVVFTFEKILDEKCTAGCHAYCSSIIASVEKVDDYTVQFNMTSPFPRLTQAFGVTIWGCDYYLLPEHVLKDVEDIGSYQWENPVTAGPYTVKDYDPNGKWILYELREDWFQSAMGVAGADHYGFTGEEAPAKYVWCRVLGDDTTRQMAMINNEVDILCEVTPEILDVMTASNPNIACWYSEFPYATSDDPCSKGLCFSMGQGEPYSNKFFRWGIALSLDFDEVSLSIFDGAGRASPFPLYTAISAGEAVYGKALRDYVVNDFKLEFSDGSVLTAEDVWDGEYAFRMADMFGIEGDEDYLYDMFGLGWWKHNPEAAEKCFAEAGLEKGDDGLWYFNGEKLVLELSYLADTEAQAGRGVQAAYDQLMKAGFECQLISKSSSTWDVDASMGNFYIAGYWPNNYITKDIYNKISGWDADLIKPVGEITNGQGTRWNNAEATEIIHTLAATDPESEESYELGLKFYELAIDEMVDITFHSGVKYVPANSTIWEGYPTADNPYNGPWWWWSCFKYIIPYITLVG